MNCKIRLKDIPLVLNFKGVFTQTALHATPMLLNKYHSIVTSFYTRVNLRLVCNALCVTPEYFFNDRV